MDQLICHLIGDYFLQTNWMAVNKTKNIFAAALHCLTYALVFLAITQKPLQLLFIFTTHFIIDYSNVIKKWTEKSMTGREPYIVFVLSVVRDNSAHLFLNYLAIRFM